MTHLPCPFCDDDGCAFKVYEANAFNKGFADSRVYIECCHCGARTSPYASEEKAWEAWDMRERWREDSEANSTAPMQPSEGECQSCVGGMCTTGPECVTLGRDVDPPIKQGVEPVQADPLSDLRERSPGVEGSIVHDWRTSDKLGGEVCANCSAMKGTRRGNEPCAAPTQAAPAAAVEPTTVKLFKTTVLGIGPYCIEFPDGEIIHTRSEDRQKAIAAALAAPTQTAPAATEPK